jgi:hypothetical protein
MRNIPGWDAYLFSQAEEHMQKIMRDEDDINDEEE